MPSDTLIIGVDFGTTFSGWPGGNNITSDKVPSEIAYATVPSDDLLTATVAKGKDGRAKSAGRKKPTNSHASSESAADAFSFGAFSTTPDRLTPQTASNSTEGVEIRWGFQVRPDEQRLRCLKLFLDPRQTLPDYVSLHDLEQQLTASGKNVGTAVADYLGKMYGHAKEILVRRYGAYFVESTPHQIVLTVPAVWSDAAKDATLNAAQAAGMGDKISMISEPEAAAVYTLQAIQPNHLVVGHNFVVIDAGGGTVDLISYGIKQLTPLRLEEMVPGSGGCCGAAFLNVRFLDFVRLKLGPAFFDYVCKSKPKTWLMALKYFEDYVKRSFDPEEQTVYSIPFPGMPDDVNAGIESGFLMMTSADVGSLFRPVIEDIVRLVDGQISNLKMIDETVDGLILVGGFGQSECLLKCLRKYYARDKIEVMQPVNAWTAVVRGL